jgi:hypothetical protein
MPTQNHPPGNRTFILYWLGFSILLIIADYFAGPFIQFPITYLIPVTLASWYNGRWWGLVFAVILPMVRFVFNIAAWSIPWTTTEATINALIRIIVLSSFAIIIDRTARQTAALSKEVQMLEGLLPICSHCKKIRDQNDEWQVMEKYIMARSAATFTHGICPECLQKFYGDTAGRIK